MELEIPNGKEIEEIISEKYQRTYGTNGSRESLEERIIGAKQILRHLVNKAIDNENE